MTGLTPFAGFLLFPQRRITFVGAADFLLSRPLDAVFLLLWRNRQRSALLKRRL